MEYLPLHDVQNSKLAITVSRHRKYGLIQSSVAKTFLLLVLVRTSKFCGINVLAEVLLSLTPHVSLLICLTLSLSNQSISKARNQSILVYAKREIGIDAFQACQITSSNILMEKECKVCYSWNDEHSN